MKWTIVFFSLLITIGSICAQDHKVSNGEAYFKEGKFEEAINELDAAIKNIELLASGNVSRAYYYHAKSLFGQFQKAAYNRDREAVLNVDLLAVKTDYETALSYDDGPLEAEINADLRLLRSWLTQMGLLHMNANRLELAKRLVEASVELKANYISYDLLGQINLNNNEYVTAAAAFDSAIELLGQELPAKPDILSTYIYYRRALISGYYSGSFDEESGVFDPSEADRELAVKTIIDGNVALENQYDQVKKNSSEFSEDEWLQVAEQYEIAKSDFEHLELDLYLQQPAQVERAILKFEEVLKRSPEDYTLTAAYASLLEDLDTKKAIQLYERAIDIDNSKELANFNLGSIYVNMAVEEGKIAATTEEADEAMRSQDAIEGLLNKARPYFERCLEINPVSMEVVKTLKQISIQLGNDEDYQLYNQMEDELIQMATE